jgi:hypothetical protein
MDVYMEIYTSKFTPSTRDALRECFTLYHMGDEVSFDTGRWRVGTFFGHGVDACFFNFVGTSRVYSSHSWHGFFSPMVW